MMKRLFFLFLFLSAFCAKAQNQEQLFEQSYALLNSMLVDEKNYSFKKGVFSIENAYLNGDLDTTFINNQIKVLSNISHTIIENKILDYNEKDKNEVSKWASVYQVMSDTIPLIIGEEQYNYIPFGYDYEDIFGHQDYANMFVSKLIYTRKGNCHSLPYLYKILCEEIGATAHLALAPHHIYIKHQSKEQGWYNTELTSGIFPNDAWLMASGFIHLDAIINGTYMKALDNKESIALLLMDLATAYEKTYPENDGTFLMKCAETAINAYPNFANALILRAELNKKKFKKEKDEEKANKIFEELEREYAHIHKIGYRFMPEEMYFNWLISLVEEKDKYENKKMSKFNEN